MFQTPSCDETFQVTFWKFLPVKRRAKLESTQSCRTWVYFWLLSVSLANFGMWIDCWILKIVISKNLQRVRICLSGLWSCLRWPRPHIDEFVIYVCMDSLNLGQEPRIFRMYVFPLSIWPRHAADLVWYSIAVAGIFDVDASGCKFHLFACQMTLIQSISDTVSWFCV